MNIWFDNKSVMCFKPFACFFVLVDISNIVVFETMQRTHLKLIISISISLSLVLTEYKFAYALF